MGDVRLLLTIPVVLATESPCWAFTLVDWLKPECMRKYRIRNTPYPTNKTLYKGGLVYLRILAIIMTVTIVSFGGMYLLPKEYVPYRLGPFDQTLPSAFVELILITLLNDLFFFILHWSSHLPALYPMHAHHHVVLDTYALATHVLDPYEILLFMLPPALGPILFGSHVYMVWAYALLANATGTLGHSGYDHPCFRLLTIDGRDHCAHHHRPKTNFCTGFLFSLVDRIFGTYRKLD
jgi:sterol desaturase/sphingolipid hydroxylase (fatty acid hydroxylase superfamily)